MSFKYGIFQIKYTYGFNEFEIKKYYDVQNKTIQFVKFDGKWD